MINLAQSGASSGSPRSDSSPGSAGSAGGGRGSPARVGINLLWLVPGLVGGSETDLIRLLRGLSERNSDLDYTLFALPSFAAAHPDVVSSFRTSYAPVSGSSRLWRVAGENSWLARRCAALGIDVVHHAGGTVPVVGPRRSLLTIHDLQYLYLPEYFKPAKLAFLKSMVPRSVARAGLVATPSEFTRRTVVERLEADPDGVVVVPHGIAPRPSASERAGDVRRKYEIEGPYFLYPAITYPHKNHFLLLAALASLRSQHPEARLVLTGAPGPLDDRVDEEIARLALSGAVKRLGYVPNDDLEGLYGEATALVFPSRFEGFGAPVLEAMSRGCPVIAARTTALPEIVDTAGVLLPPDEAEQWSAAMARMLNDEEERARLGDKGRARAGFFTWTRSAAILEDSYRRVLAGP